MVTPLRRPALCALLSAGLFACAQNPPVQAPPRPVGEAAPALPPGGSAPGILAVAARLPRQATGAWTRTAGPADLGPPGGATARYALSGSRSWATVFVYNPDGQPVPEGIGSPALLRQHQDSLAVARANAAGGAVEESVIRTAGGPPLRCAVGRAPRGEAVVAQYVCTTGIGGEVLKVRVTGFHAPAGPEGARWMDGFVAALAVEVTRALAGLPPLNLGEGGGPVTRL